MVPAGSSGSRRSQKRAGRPAAVDQHDGHDRTGSGAMHMGVDVSPSWPVAAGHAGAADWVAMQSLEIDVDTPRDRTVDLTTELTQLLVPVLGDGLVNVFVPHATAGLALMEVGAQDRTPTLSTRSGGSSRATTGTGTLMVLPGTERTMCCLRW